ncbi:MAG: hypothetical protein EOO00_07110 [Chitinophagaceae bacterium]|nr:MAG: hypothetical protein EOO00_07110 [Chitinophagaceae bacterium]
MMRSFPGLKPSFKYELAICCIAKNEEHYLAEWIEYHLKIGVTRFYIYDNESPVPITTTLASYIDRGIAKVEFIAGKKMQVTVHKHCLANHGADCKWIAFIDVDEFIVPKTSTGNLVSFLKPYQKYGGLGMHWLVFGANGHLQRPRGTQRENYTRRSLKTHEINEHIKTIVQPRHVKWVPHDPHHFKYKFGKYCVNENFERIDGATGVHTSNKIQLNHYFSRSQEDFHLKVARGRADSTRERTVDEFEIVNEFSNVVIDESILELEIIMSRQPAELTTDIPAPLHR